jgi:hypothetical protein
MMTWMLAALVGELVLLVLVLLTVSWVRNRAARRRDAKAMQALVGRVRNTKAEREATLTRVLRDNFGLEGDALGATVSALLRHEIGILQRFVGIYGSRDAGAAALFDNDVVAAIAPYHGLAGGVGSAAPLTDIDRIDTAELEALRKENRRLSDELRITMETMSRMLNEYSTMFSGAPADGAAPLGAPIGASEETLASAGTEAETAAVVAMRGAEEPAHDDAVTVVVDDAEPAAEAPVIQPEGSGQRPTPEAEKAPTAEALSQQHELSELASSDERLGEQAASRADDQQFTALASEQEIDIVVERAESATVPLPDEASHDKDRTAQDAGEPGDPESVFVDIAEPVAVDEKDPALAADKEIDHVEASTDASVESLFDEVLEEEDIALKDKGADIEVMSELLVEGESAVVAADGSNLGTDMEPTSLLDADNGGLFDDVDDQTAALAGDSDVMAKAEIDSLFDADEPAHLGREQLN